MLALSSPGDGVSSMVVSSSGPAAGERRERLGQQTKSEPQRQDRELAQNQVKAINSHNTEEEEKHHLKHARAPSS